MITFESQYGPLIDTVLNQFQSDDSKEVNLAIEALQSIVDANHTHIVDDSLKDRVTQIYSLLDKPPVEGLAVEGFKTLILIKVAAKIQELSKKSLIKAEVVIPAFTNDAKVNAKIYEALLKLRSFEFEQIEQEKGTLQLYTPLEGRSDFDSTEKFDAFAKTKEFLEGSHRCLLLMGDSGAGKTTFAYHLAQTLWQAHEKGFAKNKPIPVLIPLITIEEVEKRLIQEHFGHQRLSPEEIRLLKEHFSFVFILESYDERDCFKNLYQTNRLDGWNCKVITTCRSQSLLNKRENYRSYFSTGQLRDVLQEIILCPFTEKEIKTYIASYVNHHKDEVEWDADLYWKTLSQLPSVLALVTNPFVLKMSVLTLPDLVKKYQWDRSEKTVDDQKPLYEKMALTQAELYDAFIDAWFERQIKKMGDKLKLDNGTLLTSIDFFKFNQDIAIEMLRHKTKYLEFKEQRQTTSSLLSSISTISTTTDWQYDFFNPQNEKTTLLRSGWLLKKIGAKTYTFLHDSLRSHFAAKQLSHGIISRSTFALGHPLNDEPIQEYALIDSLADRVKKDSSLEKLIFELVYSSKYNPFVATGAANAITILCRAGISLAGKDFSQVRIQGANLSKAFLSGANFTESDLHNVSFVETSLSHVDFTGACMDGVQFGQHPLLRFQNPVKCCSCSEDGKLLAVGDDTGYIYLYDVLERNLLGTLKNWSVGQLFGNTITALGFSHNSQLLAVGSVDALIRIWNIAKGEVIQTLKGHPKEEKRYLSDIPDINTLCFSPDDKFLASAGSDSIIRIWDISSGKVVRTLKDSEESVYQKEPVLSVSFSPDGSMLASVKGRTVLWDITTEKILKEVLTPNSKDLCFGPGKILASGDTLLDYTSGELIHTFEGDHKIKGSNSIKLSPNGESFASSGYDNVVRIWDRQTGQILRSLEGHTGNITSINFCADGKLLISGSEDKTVRFWEVSSGKIPSALEVEEGNDICHLCRFDRAFIGRTDFIDHQYQSFYQLWDISCKRVIQTFHINHGRYEVAFRRISPDGKFLFFTTRYPNESSVLYDLLSGNNIPFRHSPTNDCFDFSPDSKMLATVEGFYHNIYLTDVSTGKTIREIEGNSNKDQIGSIRFSPDGKTLASVNVNKETINFWDVSSGNEQRIFKIDRLNYGGKRYLHFSPDGRILALASADSYYTLICLWDLSSGQPIQTIKDQTHYENCLCFSPDNKILASGGGNRTIRFWDIVSGKCLHTLTGFLNAVHSMVWDPVGGMIMAVDKTGAIRQYRIPKGIQKEPPILFWSSHGTQGLNCDNTTVTQVTGLSPNNFMLLKQNSSIGQVSQKKSDDILFARDQMETVGERCNTVFGHTPKGTPIEITFSNWVVSLAHKKENEHAFIILEGIENQKRVVYEAEVFLDYKREVYEFKIPLYGKLGFGYAYVQIKPISTRNAVELAKQTYFRSESITKEQADRLIELIKTKSENELRYNNLGNSKVYAIAMGNKEYGNCLTFAEEWLKVIKVNFVNETNWQATLSPFSITSQRAYFSNDKTGSSGGCSLQ